jgi:hypothetical protein
LIEVVVLREETSEDVIGTESLDRLIAIERALSVCHAPPPLTQGWKPAAR